MYGRQRAAQIGSENVFDYSLGNPSVPCPPEFTEAMQTLLAQEEPVSLHGYCPSQGDPGFPHRCGGASDRDFRSALRAKNTSSPPPARRVLSPTPSAP